MPRTRDTSDDRRDRSEDDDLREDDRATDREARDEPTSRDGTRREDDVSDWFASTAIRTGLVLIGVVLLLFALGQAFGLPLLEWVTDAVTSQTGRWLIVAFFAILLIAAAQKGFTTS